MKKNQINSDIPMISNNSLFFLSLIVIFALTLLFRYDIFIGLMSCMLLLIVFISKLDLSKRRKRKS